MDREIEAVSDARLVPSANRASLGKTPQDGKPLISQSPVSSEICRKKVLKMEGKTRTQNQWYLSSNSM